MSQRGKIRGADKTYKLQTPQSLKRSHEQMPLPSAPLKHRPISSHSPLPATKSRPPPSCVQQNRLSPARQGHEEEWTKDGETSFDLVRSVQIIMTQLNRMEKRQISNEKKIDENVRAIKQLTQESAVRRPVNPQGNIQFRTVDEFLAFEKVHKDIYNNLVGYFVHLGGKKLDDCAEKYFRSVFPEDEEVSTYLTLNGRTSGGCKLRDSRFAQACQDAINDNKYFSNPYKDDFYDALEKALKRLKTRKWRYNIKRRQAPLHEESEEENESVPLNRRRRMDNPEEDTGFENIQEEAEDANEPEETQHMEGENADDTDTQDTDGTEDNNEQEYLIENEAVASNRYYSKPTREEFQREVAGSLKVTNQRIWNARGRHPGQQGNRRHLEAAADALYNEDVGNHENDRN